MRRKIHPFLTAAAATALLCLVLFLFSPASRPVRGRLTLWYVEGDCARETMERTLARCREESGVAVEARCFADEDALAEAFETGRPDLLYCDHLRAVVLDRQVPLAEVPTPLSLPAALLDAGPRPGRAFLPVGARVPLLLTAGESAPEADSFEALFDAAGPEFRIAADSWSELLYGAMLSKGREMHGRLELDGRDRSYTALYNHMAQAALRGGLENLRGGAERYVREGLLSAAVVRSTVLAQGDYEGLAIRTVPLPEGGAPQRAAELMGFALLDAARAEDAESFWEWLWSGTNNAELALATGLVPVTELPDGSGDGEAETLLRALAQEGELRWLDPEADYAANREDCERLLRRTLDLLD